MNKLLKAIALSLASSFCMWGCVPEGLSSTSEKEDVSVISTEATVSVTNTEQTETTTSITSSTSTTAVTTTTSTSTTEPVTTTVKIEAVAPTFSLSDVPEYSGSPYIEINNNILFFTEYPIQSFEMGWQRICGVLFKKAGLKELTKQLIVILIFYRNSGILNMQNIFLIVFMEYYI